MRRDERGMDTPSTGRTSGVWPPRDRKPICRLHRRGAAPPSPLALQSVIQSSERLASGLRCPAAGRAIAFSGRNSIDGDGDVIFREQGGGGSNGINMLIWGSRGVTSAQSLPTPTVPGRRMMSHLRSNSLVISITLFPNGVEASPLSCTGALVRESAGFVPRERRRSLRRVTTGGNLPFVGRVGPGGL